MANEITITAKIKCTNSGFVFPDTGVTKASIDQAVLGHTAGVQTITTNEAIEMGDVTNPGYGYFKNLSSNETISIGLTGSYTVELKPGEVALFRCSAALFAAGTGSAQLQYIIFED